MLETFNKRLDSTNTKVGKVIDDVSKLKHKIEQFGQLEQVNPNEILKIKKTINELSQDINNLADDNTALHDTIDKNQQTGEKNSHDIESLKVQITSILKTLTTSTIRKETIEKLLKRLGEIEDTIRKLQGTKPTPTTTNTGEQGNNEEFIEKSPKHLGVRAKIMANRIYEKLAPHMPKGWKFTDSYHHAKCWRFYHARPGANSKNPGKTDTKYCLYDASRRQYFYTEAWEKFLLEKLSDPEEYKKIMHYRPTNED